MNREENSDSIPNDVILEILSKLPIKSIGRFHCVSKLWGSMLHKPYFTKLFLTRSSGRPRLLIGIRQHREWSFFSAPQPQDHYGKTLSLVVAADSHIKCSLDNSLAMCRYASGLLYFPCLQLSCKDEDGAGVICNPITGQFEILHRLRLGTGHRRSLVQRGPITSRDHSGGLIGFDPIGGAIQGIVHEQYS
ncbi:PREDICTED: putative F-box protein At5g42430 [Camelina sativa]|uniref:F-box protein At5g42430 n=1 Tax=Camelina sativa TaxID=90675 RepID=A0ABM0X4F6_CAMSA|nr:PREDICTED: putative F-box protein At5g42430 [Camelina sativa]